MNEKLKNILKSILISVVLVGILASISYYLVLSPMGEVSDDMNNEVTSISPSVSSEDAENQFYQMALVQIIGFLIVVFCLTFAVSYVMLERLRKRRNSN